MNRELLKGLRNKPRDLSAENRGYDIESRNAESGQLRFIEVKGRRADARTVTITRNELLTAGNARDRCTLAIVLVENQGVSSTDLCARHLEQSRLRYMGFWQTGYGEFHEEVGLERYEFGTSTPEYPCGACGEIFATADELVAHRLEHHPLHLPGLIVRGAEAGSRPVVITSKLEATDVIVERCERARPALP